VFPTIDWWDDANHFVNWALLTEERQHEQNVDRVGIRRTAAAQDPYRRDDERCERVANEPPAERLAREALQAREGAEREQEEERELDSRVEPERGLTTRSPN
jgi:hypothetical protein